MPPLPWREHPAIVGLCGDVRTRLGISPNHSSFRIGVMRTHLLTALFAHAVAGHLGRTATVHLRCDDTDHGRADVAHLSAPLDEIHYVAGINLGSEPIRQSQRGHRYRGALDHLDRLGVLRRAETVPCLDVPGERRALAGLSERRASVTELWVIHLPVTAADLPAAQRLARVVARWTGMLPQADPGETTVSAEDDQNVRHRVFCDLLLPGGRRCLLRADHDGLCSRRLRR